MYNGYFRAALPTSNGKAYTPQRPSVMELGHLVNQDDSGRRTRHKRDDVGRHAPHALDYEPQASARRRPSRPSLPAVDDANFATAYQPQSTASHSPRIGQQRSDLTLPSIHNLVRGSDAAAPSPRFRAQGSPQSLRPVQPTAPVQRGYIPEGQPFPSGPLTSFSGVASPSSSSAASYGQPEAGADPYRGLRTGAKYSGAHASVPSPFGQAPGNVVAILVPLQPAPPAQHPVQPPLDAPYPSNPALPPPQDSTASSTTSPWQHHHFISPSSSANFANQLTERYTCATCHKPFSRPSSLRIHSHSHTGEKPFKCPYPDCGKAFSVRSNMKRHERGCHGSSQMGISKP